MDILLVIAGVFLLWQGQLKVSKTSQPWPKTKKTGRIIGGILVLIVLLLEIISTIANSSIDMGSRIASSLVDIVLISLSLFLYNRFGSHKKEVSSSTGQNTGI